MGLAAGVLILAADAARMLGKVAARRPPDDASAMVLGLNDRRYVDPQGRFALTVPAAWVVLTGAEVAPRAAVFRGPRGLEIWVDVGESPHRNMAELLQGLRDIENEFAVKMNITRVMFKGVPAYERMLPLSAKQVLAVDFLSGRMGHHLQAAAPVRQFSTYERFLRSILDTYEAGPVAPADPLLEGIAPPSAPADPVPK